MNSVFINIFCTLLTVLCSFLERFISIVYRKYDFLCYITLFRLYKIKFHEEVILNF